MKEKLYTWEVIKNEFHKGDLKQSSDILIAESLEQVLKYLEKDRANASIDIIAINKTSVVTAIL